MKQAFRAQDLQRWIAATRMEIAAGPSDYTDPTLMWTTADVNDAWSKSANNVLDIFEEFMRNAHPQ